MERDSNAPLPAHGCPPATVDRARPTWGVVGNRTIAGAGSVLGAALVLFWVGSYGVNVPIADDWDHVRTSVRWHDDGIDVRSLLVPHNEHCLAIPRLLNHAALRASGGDFRAVLFFNAALGIAGLAVVLAFAARWPLAAPVFAPLAAAIALVTSGWCQWQNWIWAFQLPWFLLPLILVTAAVVVARAESVWSAVAATALAALLGPLCMANGLFVGWALLPALALRLADGPAGGRWRPFASAVAVVVVATVFVAVTVARSRGPNLGGIAALSAAPLEALRLFLAVLGSPLDPRGAFQGQTTLATILGGLALAVGATAAVAGLRAARTRPARDLGPGFALMAYGLASMGAVVVGRLTMLADGPVESRYHTFAIAWHVGVLLTCGWLAAERPGRAGWAWRIVAVAAASGCLVATLVGMPLFLRHGMNMQRALADHQAIYRDARGPGGRARLEGIARHYGADGILERLDGMRRAGILHADYAPAAPADETDPP